MLPQTRHTTTPTASRIRGANHKSSEEAAAKELGDRIGYGRLMQLAQSLWRDTARGGEFAVGPCVALTQPCGCQGACDWCNGSGWLTPKVKALRDALEPNVVPVSSPPES